MVSCCACERNSYPSDAKRVIGKETGREVDRQRRRAAPTGEYASVPARRPNVDYLPYTAFSSYTQQKWHQTAIIPADPPAYGFQQQIGGSCMGMYCSMFRCNINQVQHKWMIHVPNKQMGCANLCFFPPSYIHNSLQCNRHNMTEQAVERQFTTVKRNWCMNTPSRLPITTTRPFANMLTKPAVPSPKPHLDTQIPLRALGAMFVRFTAPSTTTYAESRGPGQAKPKP